MSEQELGGKNTAAVFDLVGQILEEEGSSDLLAAPTRGGTARYAMDHYQGRGVHLVILPRQ